MTVANAASSMAFQCLVPPGASPVTQYLYGHVTREVTKGVLSNDVWTHSPANALTQIIGVSSYTDRGPWCAHVNTLIAEISDATQAELPSSLQAFVDAYAQTGLELEPIPRIARSNDIISGAKVYLEKALGEALQIGQEMGLLKDLKQDSDNPDFWHAYADWLESRGDPRAEIFYQQIPLQRLKQDLAELTEKLSDILKGGRRLRGIEFVWRKGLLCEANCIDEKGEPYRKMDRRKLSVKLDPEVQGLAAWLTNFKRQDVTREMIRRELIRVGVVDEQCGMDFDWHEAEPYELQVVKKITVTAADGESRTIDSGELEEILSASLIGRYYVAEVRHKEVSDKLTLQCRRALEADLQGEDIVFSDMDFSWKGDFIAQAILKVRSVYEAEEVIAQLFQYREAMLLKGVVFCDLEHVRMQDLLNIPELEGIAELSIKRSWLIDEDIEALIDFADRHQDIAVRLEENDMTSTQFYVLRRRSKKRRNLRLVGIPGQEYYIESKNFGRDNVREEVMRQRWRHSEYLRRLEAAYDGSFSINDDFDQHSEVFLFKSRL